MAREARKSPFVWVTWVTGLLAGDDSCTFAPWFKAHHKYDKVARDDNALKQWKAGHAEMVKKRAAELTKAGYTVFLEDQNKFSLVGNTGITLSGTPDIVAVWPDVPGSLIAVPEIDALVVDCKSGKRRDKDYWQVCIYMMALPHTHPALKDRRVHGEVRYKDGPLKIHPDEEEEVRDRIVKQVRDSGGSGPPPAAVPSKRECKFCDISKADCARRIESVDDVNAPRTRTGIF